MDTLGQYYGSRLDVALRFDVLAEVREYILNGASDLSPQKRRRFVSSLNRFSDGVGHPLSKIRANPSSIANLLKNARPAAIGIRKTNWRNIVSSVLAAMREVGIDVQPLCDNEPMSPAWQAHHECLPRYTYDLSRCFRFFTRMGVEPSDARQEHFGRFGEALRHEYAIKNSALRYRKACIAWNRAVATIPDWPQVLLEVPTLRAKRRVPRMEDLTEAMRQDVGAYLAYRAKPYLADNFEDDNDDADEEEVTAIRESSLNKLEYHLLRAVGHLADCGIPLTDLTNIAGLVNVPTFKRLRDHLRDIHGEGGNSQAWGTLCALTGAARRWVYKSRDDKRIKKIQKLAKLLKPTYDRITDKNLVRLQAAIESTNFKRLLGLSGSLAARARDTRTPTVTAVHAMQIAVAIRMLLVVAPVRISTLALTKLGTHIHSSQPGLKGEVLLTYKPREIKNKVGISFRMDRGTADLVAEYMTKFRPHLAYGDPDALFPGEGGPTKGSGTLANQISTIIRDHAGFDFNVHLFRHLAGYIYLRNHPGDYETVRRLLGHKDIATTMNSYLWIDTETAIARHQDVIISLMEVT